MLHKEPTVAQHVRVVVPLATSNRNFRNIAKAKVPLTEWQKGETLVRGAQNNTGCDWLSEHLGKTVVSRR